MTTTSDSSMIRAQDVVLVISVTSLSLGLSSILIGAVAQLFGSTSPFLVAIAEDSHYKYFATLIIPTTAYVVIANWTGWQYFRNS